MIETIVPSRRAMMKGAALAATLPAVASFAVPPAFAHQDAAQWEKQVGQRFTVTGENGPAPITLLAVKAVHDMRSPRASGRRYSFTALFEMDAAGALEGGRLYEMRHPAFGDAVLFLDRTTVAGGKARLRASFN
ncbi:hypothetical protein [Sphingomonas sp.]|uniref:DUF6916 family protein n=1 Tax=Sphingomonas sp. TaxID=28214 RepID=UPI001B246DD3|nr:hypothetical protein [Sphingomonas sp.]MBO9713691.1 hypothetical protein [Sphingomonas sp.]